MGIVPTAIESAPPALGPVPPDQRDYPLSYYTQKVLEVAGRDGVLAEDEMVAIAAMLQGLRMIAQGRLARGEQPFQTQAQEPGVGAEETGDFYGAEGEPLYEE